MAPSILEEVYAMQDALAFGGACISLLNHADRVKAGCLAQLVNVIAPIMTETGGPAWRQTIFWPFSQWSNFGRGRVLRASDDSPSYQANYYDPRGSLDQWFPVTAPYLKLGAVQSENGRALTVFAVNRSLDKAMPIEIVAEGLGPLRLREALQLYHADLRAANSREDPDRVKPVPLDDVCFEGEGLIHAILTPASWTMLRLDVRGI
jgi:alpha-L-arabinofuranosidase